MTETPAEFVSPLARFLKRNAVSKWFFNKLRAEGRGPDLLYYGRNIMITSEAEDAWRRRMQEYATSDAAQLERQRLVEAARRASQFAIASPLHPANRRKRKARG